jgi:hypothetical protein
MASSNSALVFYLTVMAMVEPLKFRTMRKEGKNGKAIDIGDVLTNYHPSMTGWMSDRFAIYPQTLILQVSNDFLKI